MAILNFTLNPESLGKLHDALVCLGKFSESVSIEAFPEKLVLYALNSSKSGYASFHLSSSQFFTKYQYTPLLSKSKERFNCKIYNKALLSIFRGRSFDPEKETAVEKCDVSIEDGDGRTRSRFITKITCRHGVLKTYRLTFESVPSAHARFDKEIAHNRWSMSSKTLREFVEHFGPGTEQLDICTEDGRVSFTSFAEQVIANKEILKQPLHTTIAVDTQEFADFAVEDKLHIVVSVKDFKSIINHAGISDTVVKVAYSRPTNPLQVKYSDEGVTSEFILMTIGEPRGNSATPGPNESRASRRPASRQPLDPRQSSRRSLERVEMPPPNSAAPSFSRKASKPSPPPPQPSIQSNALFFPEADDDRRWDPVDYDEDEDGEMLLWDAGAENDTKSSRRLNGSESQNQGVNSNSNDSKASDSEAVPVQDVPPTQRLAPTQRLSEIRGVFDD
ncbi:hypothetical protein PVAG01_02394 [Phlyctema vagabunda]|uniref:DNA repair protein rad9 n=1 Tax=Phlyctema vagabunda TaxID=108571 RepID=A0ABR4PR09_9HELO